MNRAVFLDRDGTLNEDPGYLRDPSQLRLFPGAGLGLAELKRAGFLLVVVSNQSGVGRGLFTLDVLQGIHFRLGQLLSRDGATIDHYELCVHHPDDECDCRKPKPALLIRSAEKLAIDPARSYMVGDKLTDLGAGQAAGCKASILVRTGEGTAAERLLKPGQASFVADSVLEAAGWILTQENVGS